MLKKFLIGTFALLALTVAVSASAAYDFGPTTLKVGSKGVYVSTLQSFVGATADGSFGPMTKAKVMAWQAANGLVADGVFGPMSMAKANAGGTTAGLPAGCTSTAGYSTLTGQSCAASTTLPAGCMSTAGYSATTGAKCDGSTTGSTALTGGAGDVTINETSTDVESSVNEGDSDVKVHGFKVEADGSDIAITNVKVSLVGNGAGTPASSYRLNHYADAVSVWMGSTKVGSASVADFSKDGNTYSKTIALSNAVVKEGTSNKKTFYVTVDAIDNMDSTDFNATWTMTVNNIRFQDGTGVVMTDGYSETSAFGYQSLATSGDVKVVVSKGTSSPIAQNVEVSDTSSTKGVLMLEFKVKTTGSDVTFDTLAITTTLTTAGADVYSDIVGELQLKNGSDTLATIDGSDLVNGTETFNLDDTFTVDADTTETFRVYATINDADNFTSGAGLVVSFASFSPEDSNGDTIADTGSATGEKQTFTFGVPTLTAVSATLPTTATTHTDGTGSGSEDLYTATLKFTITAPEDDAVYVPKDTFAYGTAGTAGIQYTVTGGATVVSANVQYTGSDSLSGITETNSYRIDAGATQQFTLSVVLEGNDAYGKVTMTGFDYETDEGLPDNSPTATISNFYTPSVLLAK